MTDSEIQTLLDRLTHAELAGDVTALETLTTDDFALVGPLGFVLQKDEWLDRHRSGALTTEELAWHPESLRRHQSTAIAIGTQHQRSPVPGPPGRGPPASHPRPPPPRRPVASRQHPPVPHRSPTGIRPAARNDTGMSSAHSRGRRTSFGARRGSVGSIATTSPALR